MNATIFYFTGTGNSLWVAEKVSERLKDSTLVPVDKNPTGKPVTSDITCFVFLFTSGAFQSVFFTECDQCFACLQWYPQNALQYGKSTMDKKRYHHPETHLC